MNHDMPGKKRWLKSRQTSEPASERWANWARSLHRQHTRLSAEHGAVGLIFLASPPPARLSLNSQRWQRMASTLAPQINLIVAPLLRQISERTAAPVMILASYKRDAPGALAGMPRIAFAEGMRQSLSRPGEYPALRKVMAQMAGLSEPETRSASPIQLENLVAAQTRGLFNRLVEKRQRIETQTPQMVVRHKQPAVVTAITPESSVAPNVRLAPGSPANSANLNFGGVSTPFDLENLTQQVVQRIDERIVAHRERLGKVF